MNEPTNNKPYIIEPAAPPRKTITVVNGGAHRGARENLTAFLEFNLNSTQASIVPVYTDPVPGRAFALRDEAQSRGLLARAVEGRVEDVLTADGMPANAPVVLNLDRASAIAAALKSAANAKRPTLGYLLVKLPTGTLYALRFVLEPSDGLARRNAIDFFERLAEMSERNSSQGILGETADPAHLLAEPAIRRWFADHARMNMTKLAAGIEPMSNTFEVTSDGQDTLALHIVLSDGSIDAVALAEQVVENPSSPIRRGTRFVVAEVTADSIRFHRVRRWSDERLTVSGVDVIDRSALEAELAARRAEEALRERSAEANAALATTGAVTLGELVLRALARANRETVSRKNPVQTTD